MDQIIETLKGIDWVPVVKPLTEWLAGIDFANLVQSAVNELMTFVAQFISL